MKLMLVHICMSVPKVCYSKIASPKLDINNVKQCNALSATVLSVVRPLVFKREIVQQTRAGVVDEQRLVIYVLFKHFTAHCIVHV